MITTTPLEASILGSILVEGKRALTLVPELSVQDFTLGAHRDVYSAIARLAEEGTEISYVTVGPELMGNAQAMGVIADLGTSAPLAQLRDLVRQLKVARAIGKAGILGRRLTALADSEQSVVILGERLSEMSRIGQEVAALGALRERGQDILISLSEIAQTEITELEKALFSGDIPKTMETGIGRLDEMVTLQPGQFIVIGGAPGSGKSSLCAQLAVAVAQKGEPVIFVTSEMSHREMLARMSAGITGHSVKDLVNRATALEIGAHLGYRDMMGLPIDFQRSFPPKIEDAIAAIRTAVSRRGTRLAIIDYAQRLANLEDDLLERSIAKIANEAKDMALELGIVVVAAAQVNRQGSSRTDPRPVLSDLRGSGALEQNADVVLFVHQPSNYGKQGPPSIIVAKQRNGPIGEIPVVFDPTTCLFRTVR